MRWFWKLKSVLGCGDLDRGMALYALACAEYTVWSPVGQRGEKWRTS